MARTHAGAPLRFIQDVALCHEGDECLIWPYARNRRGYGKLKHAGHNVNASRVTCILAHGGPPSPDHEAAHSCGRGHDGCVSPHHLAWKTHLENHADRVEHGTSNRGERHGLAKLTEAQVREIRAQKGNVSLGKLAIRYCVSKRLIQLVMSGQAWGWLT